MALEITEVQSTPVLTGGAYVTVGAAEGVTGRFWDKSGVSARGAGVPRSGNIRKIGRARIGLSQAAPCEPESAWKDRTRRQDVRALLFL